MLGASAKIKNDDDGGGGHGGDEDDFAFGVLPDDDDEQGEEGNGLGGLDDDLLDAVNDETFGGVVLPPADDLDGFAAQTARLDLDDAGELVRRPMSTAAAKGPDASQLPLPDFEAFTFGRLVDDDGDNEPPKIMGQGAAGGGTNANGDVLRGLSFIIGNDPFTPWSSKIPNDPWLTQRSPPGSPSGAENESPWAPRLPGASSSVASNIATAVPHARTLEEIEAAYQAAQQLPIGTPPRSASLSSTSTARAAAGLQLKPPGQQQPLQSPLVPLPTGAMSIQELEHKLLSESLTHTQQQPSQQSQPPQATPVGRPQGSGPPPILQPQPHPLISALQQQAPPPPHPSFMQPQPPIPGIPPQVLNQLLPLWADLLSGRLAQLPPNVPPPPVMFIPHIRQFIAHVQQQQQMQQQGAPPLATPHHHLHQHHQMMPAAKLAPGERAPPPPLAYGLAPHNGGPPPPYLAQTREDLAKQRAAAAAANNGSGRFQMPPIQQQQHAMRTMSSSSAAADYHQQQQQQQLHHSNMSMGMRRGYGSTGGATGPYARSTRPPSMPATRTIEDFALEPFAGFMSVKEREWLVRIQQLQCQGSGDPSRDDYYYRHWRERQLALAAEAAERGSDSSDHSSSDLRSDSDRSRSPSTKRTVTTGTAYRKPLQQTTSNSNYGNDRQKQQQQTRDGGSNNLSSYRNRRQRQRRGSGGRRRDYRPPDFSGALGKPVTSTTSFPRHLIDLRAAPTPDEDPDDATSSAQKGSAVQKGGAAARKTRTILLRTEDALALTIQCEERQRQVEMDPQLQQQQQQTDAKWTELANALLRDAFDPFWLRRILVVEKARQLIARALLAMPIVQQAEAFVRLLDVAPDLPKQHVEAIAVAAQRAILDVDEPLELAEALNADRVQRAVVTGAPVAVCALLALLVQCCLALTEDEEDDDPALLPNVVRALRDYAPSVSGELEAAAALTVLAVPRSDTTQTVRWLRRTAASGSGAGAGPENCWLAKAAAELERALPSTIVGATGTSV